MRSKPQVTIDMKMEALLYTAACEDVSALFNICSVITNHPAVYRLYELLVVRYNWLKVAEGDLELLM